MKKFSALALTVLLSSSLFAGMPRQLCSEPPPPNAGIDTIHFDGRVAAFFPTGEKFRQIYGSCLAVYEFEMGKIFLKHYEVWGNVDFVTTTGHTPRFHSKTHFSTINASLGGKYVFRFHKQGNFYLGLGINEAFVHVHNYSTYVKRHTHKSGVGGVFKMGVYFEPVTHLFMEFFADYLYQTIHFKNTIQVGGVKIGGGIGFCF